jgi:WD40 repeat protein
LGLVCSGLVPVRSQEPAAAARAPQPIEVKTPTREKPVSYGREILEILENRCVGCHGSVLSESKLNLEDVAGMKKGGKRGPALVPGKSDESLLFKMAAHQVEPVMPPADKPGSKPMTPEELGLLKLWIDAGAPDDSDEVEEEEPAPIVLGELPPGIQPVNAVDLTADGSRVVAGRANVVQVTDIDSGLDIVSLGGHKDLIQSVRFSPDGSLLAAGSYRIVTLWSVPTGRLDRTFTGHEGPVESLAAGPGGTLAFSGGEDKTIRAWDLAEGKPIRSLPIPAPAASLAVSPDGKILVVGGRDGLVRLLDSAEGRELAAFEGHKGAVEGLVLLSPDLKRLATVSADGTGRIWSIPGGWPAEPKPAAEGGAEPAAPGPAAANAVVLSGHAGPVHSLAVSPDGAALLTGGEDGTIRLWDPSDGSAKGELAAPRGGAVLSLAFHPDGKSVAIGSADGLARIVAFPSGQVRQELRSHRGPVRSVVFSPAGDRIATAGDEGGIKVWESETGRGVIAFGHRTDGQAELRPVRRLAFLGDGRIASASADSTVKTWSFAGAWAERKTLEPHVDRVLAIDFSPDGTLLATGGGEPSRSGEVKLWETGKGLLVHTFDTLHSDTVYALRFSPDGTRLASASADKFVKVVSVADRKPLRSLEGHTNYVMAVDWKSDGKQIISGGADNVLKLWDYEPGEQIRTLQAAGKQVTFLRWIAGKPEVLGACGDAQVRVWNPDNGGIPRSFTGPGDYVYGVAASADGSRVVAGGADGAVFVWNGPDGKVLRKLEPPPRAPGAGSKPGPASEGGDKTAAAR